MKKTICTLILLLGATLQAMAAKDLANPLPNWIDPSRERADGRPPMKVSRAAVPADFRIPAEYETASAVVIGWAGYTSMLTAIAKGASRPGRAHALCRT